MRRFMFAALAAAAFAIPTAAPAATVEPVMTELNNPRGLAFGPEGGLYVAEAGRGGSGVCVPLPDGPGTRCYGATGAISRLWRGSQERIATGLPSIAVQPAGLTAAGPQHISFQGRGGLFVNIGCGCDPRNATGTLLHGLGFGYLMHVSASGHAKRLVDLAGYEAFANPDGGLVDSNPYGLLALPGHRLATDAGGNSLLDIAANGSVSTVATFPKIPNPLGGMRDGVPTDVVVGPDGAYYVSTLTGFPFTTGTASVYRVVPGQAPTPYATGLTQLTDLAFGPDGSLYALQHATAMLPNPFAGPGAIWKVPPGGGASSTLVVGGLPRATGLVIGPDGALYVAINGASSGNGAVLRVVP